MKGLVRGHTGAPPQKSDAVVMPAGIPVVTGTGALSAGKRRESLEGYRDHLRRDLAGLDERRCEIEEK